MIFAPKVYYNGFTLTFSLSMKPWEYFEGAGMGGEDVSAAGVPESYVVRWDQYVQWTLRFTEAERSSVMDWLLYAVQNKGSYFFVWFDHTDIDGGTPCYLETPTAKDKIATPRETDAPWVFTTTVLLRSTTGTRFNRAMRP